MESGTSRRVGHSSTHMHSTDYGETKEKYTTENKFTGVLNVIAGMLTHLVSAFPCLWCVQTLGWIPIWGNILIYITSYLRQYDETVTVNACFILYPLNIFVTAIFMQLGTRLLDIMHPKTQMAFGGALIGVSIFAMAYTTTYGVMFLLESITVAAGVGIVYMLPVRNAWFFYPNKKGTVSGIILMQYSVGAILWGFLTTLLVNPSNDPATLRI